MNIMTILLSLFLLLSCSQWFPTVKDTPEPQYDPLAPKSGIIATVEMLVRKYKEPQEVLIFTDDT